MRDALVSLLESLDGLDATGRMQAAQELEQFDSPTALLTTLRSLLRDVAAARSGGALVNEDLADRLAVLGRGPLGERAVALAERSGVARAALRGFANKLLTFDVLVDALAGD